MTLERSGTIGLSEDDRARVTRVDELARQGADGLPALISLLVDPSWAVRRAVVAALSRGGAPAVAELVKTLATARDNEARIAAAVDALSAIGADPLAELLVLSASDNPAIVCDALQVLGRRKASAGLPRVTALAAHLDDNVAVASIEAMSRIGGPDTVEPLVAAVRSGSFFRTFPAIDALGRTGDPRAIEPLLALIDDPFYAAEATRALGRTGHAAAVTGLGKVLLRGTDAIVRTAAIALTDLRDRYVAQLGDATPVVKALRRTVAGTSVSARVAASIEGAVASEQIAMAQLLGWLGDESAIACLIDLVEAEGGVARAAAEALQSLGADASPFLLEALRQGDSARRARLLPLVVQGRSPAAALVACLDDPDPGVRALACDALARAGDSSVVAALFRLLAEPDARVSQAAAAAIQSLGSLDTRRLALVEARSDDPRARRAALRILSYFAYPEALEIMVEAVADPDVKIREAAIQGLPLFDDPRALAALLRASADEAPKSRAAVMRALGNAESQPEVIATLLRGLTDADAWTRYYACQSLARLKATTATGAIIARMDDEAGQVRVAAVEALAHLRSDEALAALARAASSTDGDVRRGAIVGLGIARQPSSLPILRDALASPDPSTRLVAVSALAEFDHPEIVPLLARAIADTSDNVRGAAIGFLSTRPGSDATAVLLDQLQNPLVRDRAIAAIAVAPDQRIEGILGALEHSDATLSSVLVNALTRMRRPTSYAAVAAVLTSENVHARRAAIAALAAIGTKDALEAVRRASSDDPDPEVRRIGAAVIHE